MFIDGRPIIALEGVSAHNFGETQKWLTSGRHLGVGLNNSLGKGWLKVEVAGPGNSETSTERGSDPLRSWFFSDQSQPLSLTKLSYPELENIELWLKVFTGGNISACWVSWGLPSFNFQRILLPPPEQEGFFRIRGGGVVLALAVFTLGLSTLYHTEHPIPPIWSDGLVVLPICRLISSTTTFLWKVSTRQPRRYDYPDQGLEPLGPALGRGFYPLFGHRPLYCQIPPGHGRFDVPFFSFRTPDGTIVGIQGRWLFSGLPIRRSDGGGLLYAGRAIGPF